MKAFAISAALLLSSLFPSSGSGESLLQKAGRVAESRTNPYAADQRAQAAGQKLFAHECAGCHGGEGKGNGRAHTPPLASPLVRQADPGALFWILRNGSPSHRMPSFSHIPEQERWQIITYLQRMSPD
jgi:mono/diheme cytochrome c family protein